MDEDQLAGLYDFIAGRGRWSVFGRGVTTYPGDESDEGKHEACLELERRGLIRRRLDEGRSVTWMPADHIPTPPPPPGRSS